MRHCFYTGIIAICLSITAPAQATQDDSQKPLPQIQLLIRNANMITELCSSSYDNGGEIKGAACTLKNTIFIYLQKKGWCINDNAPTKNQWQPCKGKEKKNKQSVQIIGKL